MNVAALMVSMAVAALSYAYYWVQLWAKDFDRKLASELAEKQSYVTRGSPVIGSGIASGSSTPLQPAFRSVPIILTTLLTYYRQLTLPPSHRAIRSGVAAFQVFLSFFLMLVAMTYNSYLIAAVIAGAFLGKWRLEPELDVG
jgi:copper transporter 1